MKINKQLIKKFEIEQKDYSTEVAIKNLYWSLGAYLMNQTGVKTIYTTYKKAIKKGLPII